MKQMKHVLVVALLMLAGMAWSQPKAVNTQAAESQGKPAAGRGWSLYSTPYYAPDFARRPVVVRSVMTEAERGLAITKVGLLNRAQTVKSVRLRWYLSDDRNRGAILLRGETPPIEIEGGLPAGATAELRREVVSFGRLYEKVKDFAESGAKFHFDVSVSSAVYADGGTWEEQAVSELEYMSFRNEPLSEAVRSMKVGYRKGEPAAAAPPQSCYPNYSSCQWHSTGGVTYIPCPPPPDQPSCGWVVVGYFDCSGSVPSPQLCTVYNGGKSCSMQYCGP